MNTLAQLLEASAQKLPDRPAVEDPERNAMLTYAGLRLRAQETTAKLGRHGLAAGDRVGIYAPKSVGTVSAIFGVLAARGAYVPVDCSAPPQRNAAIFEDCTVRMLVVADNLVEALRGVWPKTSHDTLEDLGDGLMLINGFEPDRQNDHSFKSAQPSDDDVTYILYTSGSTGKPKGVVHTNSSALSFIDWCSAEFCPNEGDRFSSHAPFHFDLSVLDLFVPIKHGAALVLVGEETGKQPAKLAPLISSSKITVWYSTPSILRLLADYGRLETLDYSALRLVLFAGEVFPIKHLRTTKRLWSGPKYYNLYGPTETNVCTYYEIPEEIPEGRTEPFPIGYKCSNDETLVVDSDDMEVVKGEEGELLISGGSVMRSYWNLPERSADAFFIDSSGTSWYRTGDVVRWSDETGFIFGGRRDRMVKRRGYRVELGEIEAALYRHPLVIEAAVISVPDEENGVLIKAFMAMSDGKRPSLVEIKRFCMGQLPAYMIPDRFNFPQSLPKTSTDKVDYQSLRRMA